MSVCLYKVARSGVNGVANSNFCSDAWIIPLELKGMVWNVLHLVSHVATHS